MATNLYQGEQAILQPAQVDDKGAIVAPTSATFVSADPTKVSAVLQGDNFSAVISALGAVGDVVNVTMTTVGKSGNIVTVEAFTIVSRLPATVTANVGLVEPDAEENPRNFGPPG